MQALVIGAGPVGTFTAIGLARRGHDVTVVDRDPGPSPDGAWRRIGVMQGNAPHAWRGPIVRAMLAEMPEVLDTLRSAGARFWEVPGMPGMVVAMFARRPLVERVLRQAAQAEPGVRWRTGHADALLVEQHRVRGAVVDGQPIGSDVVVVATGRQGRLGDELRAPLEGGPCGTSYIFRTYRTRGMGREHASLSPSFELGPGYGSLVMPADNGTHHVLLIVPSDAEEFAVLRTSAGFDRAVRAIPNTAPWADPDVFEPITPVHVGGNLTNTYRIQGPALGRAPAQGLFFLGDSVCTLNPANGRSLALHIPHAKAFLDGIDRDDPDLSLTLDQWAADRIRPWWIDHVRTDASVLRRLHGEPLRHDEPLPSDVILAAAEGRQAWQPVVDAYNGMVAGPEVLDQLREPVAQMLRDGWRPAVPGPARADLLGPLATQPSLMTA